MRASASVVAAILGVAQLAAASSPGADVRAAAIARDGFYKCALMTVPDYDDRISPANLVAKAVAGKCRSWVDTMLRYKTGTEAAALKNEILRGEDGHLLGIVLRHRVLKSAPPPLIVARTAPAPRSQPAPNRQTKAAPKR